ncbi:hypothetical protein NEAUS03_2076 [Nematocida ausubeli]|nr:hypothetical protein NEAUS03_2076 [Nematocida ausubeli]
MDRTKEFRDTINTTGITQQNNSIQDSPLTSLLNISRDLRITLNSAYTELKTKRIINYSEFEPTIRSGIQECIKTIHLLEQNNITYYKNIITNLLSLIKRTEIKLEEVKAKRTRVSLNIALEPERSSVVKPKPILLQTLQEENDRILERARLSDRELLKINRKVSEIDVLQRLITEELFLQDERIDVIINKTKTASVDVKISRGYLRKGTESKSRMKGFISLFIMILSIVLIILHLGNK